ncbi:hypothetical protein H9Q69_013262 [Fusarium xylarioides]|nr:hypothetical protein H9Q69_013262 [Fusarium xylarioides]KAG5808740.1 hypothetical protein H9Q71_006786 [Fusarium xylarioides]KAG5825574.1 hypothetical protein H9Q74_004349 [Fusarium xylarioides]
MASINIVEATIADLQAALSSSALTSVELVVQYLRRVSHYDCRGPVLNAIPILNPYVFDEATASDAYRASGKPARKLEGIPFTVKDSFKVKGMTVSCASPAFESLIASDDAFTVEAIRRQGGVLLGKTNTPPMACGGMQRGIYGRAESPYNSQYLPAGFGSGSSNGSAVATAASLAAFGMAEETVSSGRSPASNNALVAYTPSRSWISIRGNWPLYPTCDVVVPHTRTIGDLLALLPIISEKDLVTKGDFWRHQTHVKLHETAISHEDLQQIGASKTLQGVRFAVPAMYIGGSAPDGAQPVTVNPGVVQLWERTRKELEGLGAEIIVVPDFPVVTAYENPKLLPKGATGLSENWRQIERGVLVAHGWDSFLKQNADPNIPTLAAVDGSNIFPQSMRTKTELEHLKPKNAIHWEKLTSYVEHASEYDIDGLADALHIIEDLRQRLLTDYLAKHKCHAFVFPAAGDVGPADADVNYNSASYAWSNGLLYSNGNQALRHLGVPTVTVPMGLIPDKQMPVEVTFAGRAYDDVNLLKWANAFEHKTKFRTSPPLAPPLQSDNLILDKIGSATRASQPKVNVDQCSVSAAHDQNKLNLNILGTLRIGDNCSLQSAGHNTEANNERRKEPDDSAGGL